MTTVFGMEYMWLSVLEKGEPILFETSAPQVRACGVDESGSVFGSFVRVGVTCIEKI